MTGGARFHWLEPGPEYAVMRSFRLRASAWRRPSPSGPGLRVHRLIVARGHCWLSEAAHGVDLDLGASRRRVW